MMCGPDPLTERGHELLVMGDDHLEARTSAAAQFMSWLTCTHHCASPLLDSHSQTTKRLAVQEVTRLVQNTDLRRIAVGMIVR